MVVTHGEHGVAREVDHHVVVAAVLEEGMREDGGS